MPNSLPNGQSKEDCAKETGQAILKTHQTFHDRVHLIKVHMSNQKHSLNRLIKAFKKKFYKENINQLRKYSEFDSSNEHPKIDPQSPQTEKSVKKNVKECHQQIHFLINLIVNAVIKYYSIDIKPPVMGGSDLKKDLLTNLITNFVLSDDIYFLIFNLISISQQSELHKLTKLLQDKDFIKMHITFQQLNLKPQFTFDVNYRDHQIQTLGSNLGAAGSSSAFSNLSEGGGLSRYGSTQVYKETIKNLLQTLQVESPMCKLEQLFTACTVSILEDLESFYKDSNFPKEKLFIDSDSLQAILIYVVSRAHYPQLWTELILIEEYIPEGVTMSNRAYYLIMVKAACEYLLNFKVKEDKVGSPIKDECFMEETPDTPMVEIYEEEQNQTPVEESKDQDKVTPDFEENMKRYNLFETKLLHMRMRNNSVLVPSSSKSSSQSPKKKGGQDTDSPNVLHTVVQDEADAFFFDNNFILRDELFEFQEGLRKPQLGERQSHRGGLFTQTVIEQGLGGVGPSTRINQSVDIESQIESTHALNSNSSQHLKGDPTANKKL